MSHRNGTEMVAASSPTEIDEQRTVYVKWMADHFGALEPNMQVSQRTKDGVAPIERIWAQAAHTPFYL